MSMTLIDKLEVGPSGVSSIAFNSIPQNYTDLQLVLSGRTNVAGVVDGVRLTINGTDLNPSGASKRFYGSGSGVAANSSFNSIVVPGNSTTANTFGNTVINFPNYTNAVQKSINSDSVIENAATTSYQMFGANLSTVSAPITSISIGNFDSGGTAFLEYTTAYLYGISRQSAIGKPKAIGGSITFANGHWAHTFNGSGTFTPLSNVTCDVLLVGGGGGGGARAGGGGGGGGVVIASNLNIPANTSQVVTVGSGGAGDGNYLPGTNGTGSEFMQLIAYGGGGGGAFNGPALSGASGGGGSDGEQYSTAGGAGVAGQGFAGGVGYPASQYSGGGGGGAAGVGSNAQNASAVANSGGPGMPNNFNGSSSFYGSGGSGGTAYGTSNGTVTPGGGIGAIGTSAATSGWANTGGGGGGGGWNGSTGPSAAGGSGVVIIRYPAD